MVPHAYNSSTLKAEAAQVIQQDLVRRGVRDREGGKRERERKGERGKGEGGEGGRTESIENGVIRLNPYTLETGVPQVQGPPGQHSQHSCLQNKTKKPSSILPSFNSLMVKSLPASPTSSITVPGIPLFLTVEEKSPGMLLLPIYLAVFPPVKLTITTFF